MSSYITLDLAKLAEIDDGVLGVLVKKAMQAVARDCVDRPTDPTERTVTRCEATDRTILSRLW